MVSKWEVTVVVTSLTIVGEMTATVVSVTVCVIADMVHVARA